MSAAPESDVAFAATAAAMGDPTRARILLSLMDGRARTGTELAALGDVGASTISAHLHRLEQARLIAVRRQGRYRYYSLGGGQVAAILERLSAFTHSSKPVTRNAPAHLRVARTCYDHIAGAVGVAVRERLVALGWLTVRVAAEGETYDISPSGTDALVDLGIDVEAARCQRRRFAFGCLDWTERRFHLGGALGAAVLALVLRKKWLVPQLDSRALRITWLGRHELAARLGISGL